MCCNYSEVFHGDPQRHVARWVRVVGYGYVWKEPDITANRGILGNKDAAVKPHEIANRGVTLQIAGRSNLKTPPRGNVLAGRHVVADANPDAKLEPL